MTSHDYLVEMNFAPFASPPTPQEVAAFAERFALPTLDALEKLAAAGRILAGGPFLAAVGFSFVARAASPEELEEMVTGLPLWTRAQTRVVPLGTFEGRAATLRRRLRNAEASGRESVPTQASSPLPAR
jgi:hypothetical protein